MLVIVSAILPVYRRLTHTFTRKSGLYAAKIQSFSYGLEGPVRSAISLKAYEARVNTGLLDCTQTHYTEFRCLLHRAFTQTLLCVTAS